MRVFRDGQYYYDVQEASEVLGVGYESFFMKQGRYGVEQLPRITIDRKVFIPVVETEKIFEERAVCESVSFVMEFLVKGLESKLFRSYFDGCICRADAVRKANVGGRYSFSKAAQLQACVAPFVHLYHDWLETDLSESEFLKKRVRDISAPTPEWSKSFLITQYWQLQKSVPMIAEEFGASVNFVWTKIREHGLQKQKNGIRLRGRRNYTMPDEEKAKRRNQPHAKRVTAIDAKTLEIKKTYRSITATEEDGFSREHVKRAVRTVGVHRGHLWALEGTEAGVIQVAKKRGLEKKLEVLTKKRPSKKWLYEHYVVQDMTAYACAKKWGCSTGTITRAVREYELFKRKNKPTLDENILLREMLAGNSVAEIARKYGRKKETVQTYIWRWRVRGKMAAQMVG